MIVDVRTWTPADREHYRGARVLLDGREIPEVWYVDTDAGIVKTYAVLFDAPVALVERIRAALDRPALNAREIFAAERFSVELLPADYEIESPPDAVVSRTLRGAVSIER